MKRCRAHPGSTSPLSMSFERDVLLSSHWRSAGGLEAAGLVTGASLWVALSWALEAADLGTGLIDWSFLSPSSALCWGFICPLESWALFFTNSSTKCICFWRISTNFFWREARETSWVFDTRCQRESDTRLHRKSNCSFYLRSSLLAPKWTNSSI